MYFLIYFFFSLPYWSAKTYITTQRICTNQISNFDNRKEVSICLFGIFWPQFQGVWNRFSHIYLQKRCMQSLSVICNWHFSTCCLQLEIQLIVLIDFHQNSIFVCIWGSSWQSHVTLNLSNAIRLYSTDPGWINMRLARMNSLGFSINDTRISTTKSGFTGGCKWWRDIFVTLNVFLLY